MIYMPRPYDGKTVTMRVFIVPAWAAGIVLVMAPPILYHTHYGIVWVWMCVGMPEVGAHMFAGIISFAWLFGWLFWIMESGRVSLTSALCLPRIETREVTR